MSTSPAERMRALCSRRRARAEREIRIAVPDTRSECVRERVAQSVARLDPDHEADALSWIESVADFDEREAR